jgi:serine/threonine protein kinase
VPTSSSPLKITPTQLFAADAEGALGSEPEVLPVGFALNNYVIQACIGRGAMGVVYRAQHSLLKKQVALKVMSATLLTSTDARHRFFREAQAAAAVKHPHVVDILDVGVAQGTPYLVMELLEGIDLEKQLEARSPLSNAELVALALPLIAALGAAHDAGVVHRDLKPGNIFLARGSDGVPVPKLLDFGVSKFSGFKAEDLAMTPFDQLLGSPLYLPPEALQGARELTPLSDQYSLAVVLYECITGKPPFACESLLTLLNAISASEFAPPRQIAPETSPAVERAILRAMSADPSQRFEHIRDLGQALLADADLRTRALWNPSFGLPLPTLAAALEPTSLAVTPTHATPASGAASDADRAATASAPPAGTAAMSEVAAFQWLSTEPKRRSTLGLLLGVALVGLVVLWVAVGQNGALAPSAQPVRVKAREAGPPQGMSATAQTGAPRPLSAEAAAPNDPTGPLVPASDAAQNDARARSGTERLSVATSDDADLRNGRESSRPRKATPGGARSAPRASTSTRAGRSSRADDERELRQLFFPAAAGSEGPAVASPGSDDPTPVANEAPIFD